MDEDLQKALRLLTATFEKMKWWNDLLTTKKIAETGYTRKECENILDASDKKQFSFRNTHKKYW